MKTEAIIRMVAGAMVLSSVGLGHFVHPLWFALTAFVGANLLQSSITGFCPLEWILLKSGSTRT